MPQGPEAEAEVEIEAGLALCRSTRERAGEHLTPEQAEDLLLVDGFVRRPPPELTVLPQDADRIKERLARARRQSAA